MCMDKKYEVKVTRQAMAQMKEIVHYISAELLAPEAANKLLDKMRDAIAALSFMPKKYALIWKGNYAYLTEMVMVLNHKIWQWYKKNILLAKLYNQLYDMAAEYAENNLKGEELDYYYRITD